jgi:hypothetical protein
MTLGKDLEKHLLVKSVLVNDYGNGLTIFGGLFWCVGSLESYEAGIKELVEILPNTKMLGETFNWRIDKREVTKEWLGTSMWLHNNKMKLLS